MSTLRWFVLAIYLIPVRYEHLWMYSVDAIAVFGLGYYWKYWSKRHG